MVRQALQDIPSLSLGHSRQRRGQQGPRGIIRAGPGLMGEGRGGGLPLTLSSLQCRKAGTVGPNFTDEPLSPERLPVQSARNVSGLSHDPLAD